MLDLVLAPCLLLATLPVLVVAALAILVDSRGPVIFTQVRVGAGGRRFRLYKLRTMTAGCGDGDHLDYVAALISGDARPHRGLYKLVDDSRITRAGRVLRRWSVDELPQLWNVIRGDMSLVGPRPPMPSEVELYDPWMWERLSVKPGITGLWQVSGRCELPFADMVALDIEYWRNWSALLELQILVRSVPAVFRSRGAA